MKKVLKSVVAVVLCLAMVLSLAACGPKYTNGISTEEFTDLSLIHISEPTRH